MANYREVKYNHLQAGKRIGDKLSMFPISGHVDAVIRSQMDLGLHTVENLYDT
jgi:hypothetical protein